MAYILGHSSELISRLILDWGREAPTDIYLFILYIVIVILILLVVYIYLCIDVSIFLLLLLLYCIFFIIGVYI